MSNEERMSILYFGPYNDPGDTQTFHHWDPNHDPDCHNSAFTVDRVGQLLNITLAVRNRDTSDSPNDVLVTLYAAVCGLFGAVTDVNALVQRILRNGDPDPINNQDKVTTYVREWAPGTPVPAFKPTFDDPLILDSVQWSIPAYSNSVILVATLSSATGGQQAGLNYTQDPCVAVWLG
jgi:hypothetical protein